MILTDAQTRNDRSKRAEFRKETETADSSIGGDDPKARQGSVRIPTEREDQLCLPNHDKRMVQARCGSGGLEAVFNVVVSTTVFDVGVAEFF